MVQLVEQEIGDLLKRQRVFFATGQTRDVNFRIEQLKRLRQAVVAYAPRVLEALKADLGKPELEAYVTEVGVLQEIDFALKHIRSWAKPQKVSVPAQQWPASAWIQAEPLGVVLIIGPWNYPFQLMLSPLVGAIAAGNCTILKPSELAPATSQLVADLISKTFDSHYITVVEGDVHTSQALLAEKFDHIFFTGGTAIGKIVMAAAAKHLTPVTLELGGKSPCIVDSDIHLLHTARRIIWGKFLNSGQTCIAPDYLLVNRQIKPTLLEAMVAVLKEFYGENPETSPDYGRIISLRHFLRLQSLLTGGKAIAGGTSNAETRYIAPTILDNVSPDDPIMQEEIFGPILPVLEYGAIEEAIALIQSHPKPLALYLFTQNQQLQERVLRETSSGGVCLNDTIMQVGISSLPFGGVGDSGIGSYHGRASFDTFSHRRSILKKPFWLDVNLRYPPYAGKLDLLKKIIG
jgi:aldehyde dehydrogenase (NAD+)